jgi:Domain of unknown function (DUF3846)
MMATLIPTDGAPRDIAPHAGPAFTLQELQQIVGGYIEMLWAPDGRCLFLNEDGKRLELPINDAATLLMRRRLTPGDYIVGDVILCTRQEAGADTSEDA